MDPEARIFNIVEIVLTVLISKHMRVNRLINQGPLVLEHPVRPVCYCHADAAIDRIVQVERAVRFIIKNIGSPDPRLS